MNLEKLFIQLKTQLTVMSPARIKERNEFIETKIAALQDLNLSEHELLNKINGYLEYSTNGVFSALAFRNLDLNLKSKIIEQIDKYSFMYNLQTEEINYPNSHSNGIKAYFDEIHEPKIAVICCTSQNIGKVITFVDKDELLTLLNKEAIEDCFNQYRNQQISASILVNNIIRLSDTKDNAFIILIEGINYNLNEILDPLLNEFNLETQLDKLLRNIKEFKKIEQSIINQLQQNGSLASYKHTRLNKNSILPESAQRRLADALVDLN
jgi:hypothetical protein